MLKKHENSSLAYNLYNEVPKNATKAIAISNRSYKGATKYEACNCVEIIFLLESEELEK